MDALFTVLVFPGFGFVPLLGGIIGVTLGVIFSRRKGRNGDGNLKKDR